MSWLTTADASHRVEDGETVVGSGSHANWRLPSNDLGTRHFVISRHSDRFTLRPATVESVVVLNGNQIGLSPVELHDGDTIDAGDARFTFSTGQDQRPGAKAIEVLPAHLVETRDGIAHPLTAQSVGIGRDAGNLILIRDPTASRFHAEVRREAGGYVLHPRGSSGTTVNDRRTGTPERLRDGDRIGIANMELRFVMGSIPPNAPRPGPSSDDVDASRRRTMVQAAAMEIPTERSQSSTAWIWGIVALILAGVVYLATR